MVSPLSFNAFQCGAVVCNKCKNKQVSRSSSISGACLNTAVRWNLRVTVKQVSSRSYVLVRRVYRGTCAWTWFWIFFLKCDIELVYHWTVLLLSAPTPLCFHRVCEVLPTDRVSLWHESHSSSCSWQHEATPVASSMFRCALSQLKSTMKVQVNSVYGRG